MTIQLTSEPGAAQRERWLRSALVASWLAFAASVWLRPTRGEFDPWLDAGLYNVSFHISRPLPPSSSRAFLSNRACPASMVSASNTIGR